MQDSRGREEQQSGCGVNGGVVGRKTRGRMGGNVALIALDLSDLIICDLHTHTHPFKQQFQRHELEMHFSRFFV